MRRITGTTAFKVACAVVCVMSLCIVLVGCGSKNSSGSKAGADLIGDWTVTSMETGGETMDMTSYSSLGYYITLTINEDGTCIYRMTDEEDTTGTWTGKDASTGTVTILDETFDASIDGGNLVLVDGSDKLILASGISSEASSAAGMSGSSSGSSTSTSGSTASSSSSSGTVAMNFTICDDEYATVTITGKVYDSVWGAGYEVKITNKSDKDIYVSVPWDSSSVNGTMNDMTLGETVKAGKNATADVYFMDEVASVNDLKDVEGTLQVLDDATYDTLSEYTFTIPD